MSIDQSDIVQDACGWPIHGAKLDSLDGELCTRWLDWLLNKGHVAPENSTGVKWAVAQWDRAFAWAVLTGEQWTWGEGEPLDCGALIEMRVFGPEIEVLIWRTETTMCGRALENGPFGHLDTTPLISPRYNIQLDRVPNPPPRDVRPADGFVVRSSSGGNITVTPPGKEIIVCHYLSECPSTGVLRIALTRMAGFAGTTQKTEGI